MNTLYIPPKIWKEPLSMGNGVWSNINRSVSGHTFHKLLPIGKHPIQLYSMGTPNGQKVAIMLEELLNIGINEAEYDAHLIDIRKGEQFSSGFVEINPNSKIPAMVDYSKNDPVVIFESGAILLYLAEKFNSFIPEDINGRNTAINWLFWLQGASPFLGGGFGHFYIYAEKKHKYAIDRYTMEVKRHLDLLNKQLSKNDYIAGKEYSIADIAIWPWYGNLVLGYSYNATEFLNINEYTNVIRWANHIFSRTAVKRGRIVNKVWGEELEQLCERHNQKDIDNILNRQV